MEIKKMEAKNINAYVGLYKKVFSQAPWFIEEDFMDLRSYFSKYFSLNNFLGYDLYIGSRLIGFSLGYKKPWIPGYEYYIDQFCIDPDYQKKGYGRLLLKFIEADKKKEDLTNLILMTEKTTPAYGFYKGLGFTGLGSSEFLIKEL